MQRVVPQAPQSAGSTLVSAHTPLQSVVPLPHAKAQAPWLQVWARFTGIAATAAVVGQLEAMVQRRARAKSRLGPEPDVARKPVLLASWLPMSL